MSEKTQLRKDQIHIEEFIQALSSVNWNSDTLTASAAAISQKIASEIANVAGAMIYQGEWSSSTTPSSIKKGYVYVYAGADNGSIAASQGDPAVILEPGDTLIAKQDNADPTRSSHWTIVNVNITGAITQSNLKNQLLSHIASGNTNSLTIAEGTGNNAGKVVLTVNFPTISMSSGDSNPWVFLTGININATSGVITVKYIDPTVDIVVSERKSIVTTRPVTYTTSRRLKSVNHISMYVNGVKQALWTSSSSPGANDIADAVVSIDNDTGAGLITFQNDAYTPQSGDVVVIDYISAGSIVSTQQ